MNPEYIINSIKQTADMQYDNGANVDRLAYRVGMLESNIRVMCTLMQFMSDDNKAEVVKLKKQTDNLI